VAEEWRHAVKGTEECTDSLQFAMKSFRIASTIRHDIWMLQMQNYCHS
jgi:hypothetical protein